MRWDEIYQQLCAAVAGTSKPPVPLILNGWWGTNDIEKANRWRQTVDWAKRHGLEQYVQLGRNEWYTVESPSSYAIGPMGGPLYLDWKFTPAIKHPPETVLGAFQRLTQRWREVTEELSGITLPLRITGKKDRRLVVAVYNETSPPPWGNWHALPSGELRRKFTAFRAAVNHIVAPLEIDHIDFEIENSATDEINDAQ
jgi:hypothetical protein